MTIAEYIRIALGALRDHKLRSLLTMLGIIIGVGAVVAMMSIGASAKKEVTESVADVGGDLFFVMPGAGRGIGVRTVGQGASALKERDAEIILRQNPQITGATGVIQSNVRAVWGNNNVPSPIFGVRPEFLAMQNWRVDAGRNLSERDVRASAKVALIGPEIVLELFGGGTPVGRTIRIENTPVEIVGVLSDEGHLMTMANPARSIIVPITTLQRRILGESGLAPGQVNFIMAKVAPGISIETAQEMAARTLRQEKRVRAGENDPFSLMNLKEVVKFQTQMLNIVTMIFAGIASLSLLVGGIGIMNIMLVSVTERRHEIGVRMSVGARGRDITRQFLTESAVLCVVGGFIGVALGALIAGLFSKIVDLPFVIEAKAVILAILVSAGIGLFFGYYPARKAARLDPIAVLRFE